MLCADSGRRLARALHVYGEECFHFPAFNCFALEDPSFRLSYERAFQPAPKQKLFPYPTSSPCSSQRNFNERYHAAIKGTENAHDYTAFYIGLTLYLAAEETVHCQLLSSEK